MYWIYLVIFVTMVFVPDIIKGDFFVFEEKILEELSILFLGGLGFIFYLIKDRQLTSDRKDRAKAQEAASRMSKDLTGSYSFIGEANRKLEIFKNISLGLPAWLKMPIGNGKEVFSYIMSSIGILTKSDKYRLVFLEEKSQQELLVISSKNNLHFELTGLQCLKKNKKYFETEEFIIAVSPENIGSVTALLIIKKKVATQVFDDPDILKAILSQALFLYVFIKEKKMKS